jgi:hypothetical protein
MNVDCIPRIGHRDLKWAYEAFRNNEPRDLFYRVARSIVEQAQHGKCPFTTGDAVGVLLQTWNRRYYQHFKFTTEHLADIENLLRKHRRNLASFSNRSLKDLDDGMHEEAIGELYDDFELVLGPVGAAKCLHLLAPDLFPLWDRTIAGRYGCALQRRGTNAPRYLRFMKKVRTQCQWLRWRSGVDVGLLKALDEYNYCVYTLGLQSKR